MRQARLLLLLGIALCAAPATSAADILSLRLQAQGGTASGKGLSGDLADEAFHAGASGITYGAIVGVEVLFIDVWVEHNQYQDSQGLAGTWTQFMTGLDIQFDISQKTRGGKLDDEGRIIGGDPYAPVFAEIGGGLGFGVGTGQQIDLPLDNSEVSDKGFLLQGHAGLNYRLTPRLSLGAMVPVQIAYMFKNGADDAANDPSSQYRSLAYAFLVDLRYTWKLR